MTYIETLARAWASSRSRGCCWLPWRLHRTPPRGSRYQETYVNNVSTSAAQRDSALRLVSTGACKLSNFIAPKGHAGDGSWSTNADIPLRAWPASLVLVGSFLFGPEILGWLLRLQI